MRLLVLGGTWFLGREVAAAARRRGWGVTAFHRGVSGSAPSGVEVVRGDRRDRTALDRLAGRGPWDAVVDTSASELAPRDVLLGAQALRDAVGCYVFVSTVSVYRGWPREPLSEDSDVFACPVDAGPEVGARPAGAEGPNTHYGVQKAGAEAAVRSVFGRCAVVLRPGVILGPGEYVGRLPWWLRRAERGGRMLAPGDPARAIQPIDVRDVAAFALDQAFAAAGGVLNVAAPAGAATMADLLGACVRETGGRGELVWVPDEVLVEHGVRQWTELPLWRVEPGAWQVDASAARRAGLQCRPLGETVADTWAWLTAGGQPVEHPRARQHGMDAAKEARILAAVARG